MSTSNSHQEFKKGYSVPEGEEKYYHILFVDKHVIGKSIVEQTSVQKYAQNEWPRIKKTIEDMGIGITAHDEFSVLHDPTAKKPGRKPVDNKPKEE